MTVEEKRKRKAEYMKAYYHSHPEYRAAVIARSRAVELANPEAKRDRQRRHYRENLETERKRNAKRSRAYRGLNSEKTRAAVIKWKAENPEKVTAHRRRWQKEHRIELNIRQRGRNYKIKAKIIKENIANWHTRICGICNLLIEGKFEIDHKIPLVKGGLHVAENLQLAHPFCNRSKHDKIL